MSLAAPATPFPFIHTSAKRRKNTWYSIGSGNWTDPNIWICNALTPTPNLLNQYPGQGSATYVFPRVGDDVYIGLGHTVTCDTVSGSTTTLNNLYVAGSFVVSNTGSRTLTILGDLQSTGLVNLTSVGTFSLNLFGVNNFINSFISGTASTVTYTRSGDQAIMDLPYRNLTVTAIGTKYLTNNLNIAGNFSHNICTFETSIYDFTVTGTSAWGSAGLLGSMSKSGSGLMLFIGAVSWQSGFINFSGNPTVEFRGGLATGASTTTITSGTNAWNFTTNTQSITLGSSITLDATVSIVGAITVTNAAGAGNLILNKPIDNTVAGGSVINRGQIYFNSTSSLPSFTTGTFDRTSFANTVGYTMPASITLPYTAYSSLYVSNTGIKTLAGSSTLSGSLTLNSTFGGTTVSPATLEFATYDISIAGTTQLLANTSLSKTGAGNIIFGGAVSIVQNNVTINFTGNPTMEFRGGLTNSGGNNQSFGTGTVSITTTTQSFAINAAACTFATVSIVGSITLNVTGGGTLQVNTVNGTVAGSTLINKGVLYLAASALPMVTGVFDNSTNANTLGYAFNGDYTLPYTSYSSLYIGGSGTKTLSGTTVLNGGLTVSANAALELSSFNFTVSTTTNLFSGATFSKNGSGSILFIGALGFQQLGVLFSLTGNPSVELRGGISVAVGSTPTLTGAPTLTFSTNNQSIITAAAIAIPYNIIISGVITVTESGTGALTLSGTLNGNNAASTFDNRGTVNYQNAQQPMLTGVLQTNLAANTFIYNAAGNQDVKGGTYRTLQLAGSGVKTLQGNVVAATAYTLTPPATLNLNGFTRT